MSLDQKIALQVIDEPQIIEITNDGEEKKFNEMTEEDQFFQIWAKAGMKKENLNKEKSADDINIDAVRRSACNHLILAKEYFNMSYDLLNNTERVVDQNRAAYFKIDPVTNVRFRGSEKSDVKLGALIVDKQLQLQSSAEKLFKSVEELKEVVSDSKTYYRQLEDLQHKVRLTQISHPTKLRSYVIVENPVPTPRTTSANCVLFDKNEKKLKMMFSDDFRVNVNGKYYEHDVGSDFLKYNCMLMQNTMYKHLQIETSNEFDNYSVSGMSTTIPIDEKVKVSFEKTGEKGEVCPVWLPGITAASIPPGSMPLKRLRGLIQSDNLYTYLFNLIISRFTHTNMCKVFISHDNKCTTFKISSTYTSDTVVAIAKGNKAIVSTPTHLKQPTVIDLTNSSHINRLNHWADVTWFILFEKAITTIASSFNFNAVKEKNRVTINCDDRDIEFEASNAANEAYVTIRKKGVHAQCLLWSSIRGYSLEYKIKSIFFVF